MRSNSIFTVNCTKPFMAISFQRDITEFLFIVERKVREREEKIVTNAITIIFNLYTYIRVFMVMLESQRQERQNLVNLEL